MFMSNRVGLASIALVLSACRAPAHSGSSPSPRCPTKDAVDTTVTGVPLTQYCDAAARARLARLVRALPADTAAARLADMVTYTEYPDEHILDAALTVASNAAATRSARVAALQIVAKQVHGSSAEITAVDAANHPVAVKAYAENIARCRMIRLSRDFDATPSPPPSALDLVRQRLAITASAKEHDPVIRTLAGCIIGG